MISLSKLVPSLRLALFGILASFAALLVDTVLLRATLGLWIIPPLGIVSVHLGLGLLIATFTLGLALIKPDLAKTPMMPVWIVSVGFSLVYGFSLWERVCHVARLSGGVGSVLVGLGVVVLLFLMVTGFSKVGEARDSGWLGGWLVGVMFACLLVGNRTVVEQPFATASLLFDLGAVVLAVILLVALRGRFSKMAPIARSVVLMGGVLGVAAVALGLVRWTSDQRIQQSGEEGSSGINVIVLVLDTMRGDVFYDVLENTEEGRSLQRALGPMAWFTEAVAAGASTPPTMSSIFSGLYPPQHGIDGTRRNWTLRIRKDVTLLAERLQEEGYATIALVANRALRRSIGVHRGFEFFFALRTPTELFPQGLPTKRLIARPGPPHVQADLAGKMLSTTLRRIHQERRPTFLWFHLMDNHSPLADHSDLPRLSGDENLTDGRLRYRNSARFAQAELAIAVQDLRKRFPREKTITIVLADHGEMLVEDGNTSPGMKKKAGHGHSFFESIVHVPLGIQLPTGLGESTKTNVLASQIDILPTIYDVLGIEADRELPGCSLVHWIQDPTEPGRCRDFAVSTGISHNPGHRALRTPRLKVMYSEDEDFPPRLYELADDPGETNNLVSERPEALAASIALLRQFWLQFEGERSGAPAELDAETVEKLKALGYLQ